MFLFCTEKTLLTNGRSMGNKYVCIIGYTVPFIQTRLSPFQIKAPSTELRLPNDSHMKTLLTICSTSFRASDSEKCRNNSYHGEP